MKQFMILTVGYEKPTKEIMDAWMSWFAKIKDRMVGTGNPFGPGKEVTPSGTKDLPHGKNAVTGFCMINARNMSEAVRIAKGCPMITSVRVYEAMSM